MRSRVAYEEPRAHTRVAKERALAHQSCVGEDPCTAGLARLSHVQTRVAWELLCGCSGMLVWLGFTRLLWFVGIAWSF